MGPKWPWRCDGATVVPLHQTLELPVPQSAIALVFLSHAAWWTGMSTLRSGLGGAGQSTGTPDSLRVFWRKSPHWPGWSWRDSARIAAHLRPSSERAAPRMPAESQLDAAQKSVREYFSRMSALRSAHPALRYGNRRLLVADENRYAFVRRHFDDRVLAVWNRGSAKAEYDLLAGPELPDGNYTDALTGKSIAVSAGQTKFSLEPMQAAFFVPEGPTAKK